MYCLFDLLIDWLLQQQSQLSNASNSDSCSDDTCLLIKTWQDVSLTLYDLLIIGSSCKDVTKEIGLLAELHKKSSYCDRVLICADPPGISHSKCYYLEEIKSYLTNCKQEKGRKINIITLILHVLITALIWYSGHGEKNTGNWCFHDGVITFQDIFCLCVDYFRGKQLTINCDCSYSGNWIRDCAKALDVLRIPPCGHHTRENGLSLSIWTSCGANEESEALCFIKEANIFDETNKGVFTFSNLELSSKQTTKWGDFRKIRCNKGSKEKCEIDTTFTWEEHIRLYQTL